MGFAGVFVSFVLLFGRPAALRQLPQGLSVPAVCFLSEGDEEPVQLSAARAETPGKRSPSCSPPGSHFITGVQGSSWFVFLPQNITNLCVSDKPGLPL